MAYGGLVSEATLRRMPTYLHYLRRCQEEGTTFISSGEIGSELGLDPTQVRKDVEVTGIVGKPRVGFSVAELALAIEEFLGWNKLTEAFLAGAGNLGTALLGYDRLKNYGVHIVAAFDSDPRKVGTEIYGRQVLSIDRLANLAERMHVLIGIITVPADQAQAVADQMVAGGIQAIWNFAPVNLRLPKHIIVQHEELYYTLAALSRKLAAHLRETPQTGGAQAHASHGTPP
jgi:redox-sensing transcriptional repressor